MRVLVLFLVVVSACTETNTTFDTEDAEPSAVDASAVTDPTCDEIKTGNEEVFDEVCYPVVEDGCLKMAYASANGASCVMEACIASLPEGTEIPFNTATCDMDPSVSIDAHNVMRACACFTSDVVINHHDLIARSGTVSCGTFTCPMNYPDE